MDEKNYFDSSDLDAILGELEGEVPAEEPLTEDAVEETEDEYREEYEAYEEEEEEYDEEYEGFEEPPAPRRRRRVWPWVVLGVFLLFVGVTAALGFYAYGEVKDMASVAYSLIDEAKVAVDEAKAGDFAAVERTLASVDQKLDGVDQKLDEPLWKLAAKVPGPGDDLTALRSLFGIWDRAYGSILTPALSTLQTTPLPELDGVEPKALLKETDLIRTYAELALQLLPECQRCMDEFDAIPELSIPQLEEKMAQVRALMDTARPFLPLAADMLEHAALPAVDTLERAPLEDILSEEEYYISVINTDYLLEYLALAENVIPRAEVWVDELDALATLPSEKLNETITSTTAKVRELFALYHTAEKYIPLAKAYLDVDGYREYLLAIQNTAEIRAGGGFPGNMCALYLKDGKLYVGEFRTAYGLLKDNVDGRDQKVLPSLAELDLFYEYMLVPRDAVINPHFPRVAEIWCRSGNEWGVEGHIQRDGVISIAPSLVQDFLAALDTEVELSDGTVLNGSNATRFLQHDLYRKYFNNWDNNVFVNNQECDAIFAETAKKVLDLAKGSLRLDAIDDLVAMVDKNIAERTMKFWLADEDGQAIIEELGASGGLNNDPENPQVGVYFSCTVSSKLGWYLDIDVDIGEGRKSGDVMTYPVTITLENTLEFDEYNGSNGWLVGLEMGDMKPFVYLFGPAGGTIQNIRAAGNYISGMYFQPATYQGLELGYHTWGCLALDHKITITCDVTTAPGVETVPTVSKTPTLQDYR